MSPEITKGYEHWQKCIADKDWTRAEHAAEHLIPQLVQELRRLDAIVERLPKTAKGEPVIDGSTYVQLCQRSDGSKYELNYIATTAAITGDFYDPNYVD